MRRVPASVYTEEYYLTDCTGYNEFKESFGEKLEIRFQELLKYFSIQQGMKVLDIGCGRGELVLYAAKHGAEAVGIDYSKDAIKLAEIIKSRQKKKLANHMKFLQMDAKKLTFKENSFDLIILTDVVEHLYPEELEMVFGEVKKILKPGGIIVMHTAPNKLFNNIGYRFYSYPLSVILVGFWNMITGSKYPNIERPAKLRTDSHLIMHINEPTYFSLKNLFNKFGFDGDVFSTNITAKKPEIGVKDVIFNFIIFWHPISKKFPFNVIMGSDFVSIVKNKK